MKGATRRLKFRILCSDIEKPEAVDAMLSQAEAKGIHPRILAGVKWGLFSEEKGKELPDVRAAFLTKQYAGAKRKAGGFVSAKKKYKIKTSSHIRTGKGSLSQEDRSLGSQTAAALRYMAVQRDSMSD